MYYAIIAAGEGSRLAREGVERPKPLIELCGCPMVERLMRIFADLGAEGISIIVNEQMTDVLPFVREVAATLQCPVTVICKSTPSSMHSFYEVARSIPGNAKFIATTVDTIFRPEEFAAYSEAFAADTVNDGAMGLTDYIDDEKPLYVDVDSEMMITAFRDSSDGHDRYISGGIYGLSRDKVIPVLEDCLAAGVSRMRNFQRALLAAGLRLRGCPFDKILDVDHAADIPKAEAFLCGRG